MLTTLTTDKKKTTKEKVEVKPAGQNDGEKPLPGSTGPLEEDATVKSVNVESGSETVSLPKALPTRTEGIKAKRLASSAPKNKSSSSAVPPVTPLPTLSKPSAPTS
jgi:hypothetical protein